MPDLTFTGIGSGLKVNDIVSAIVGAEVAPYASRYNKQQAAITTDISAIGALKSALESVTDSIESLSDIDNFQQRTASGADSFVGMSTSKDAQIGNYSVKVDALAQAHKLMSGAIDSEEAVGEGTLNIAVNTADFDIAVSATDTLSDIRDAINDSVDNDSVIATIVTNDAGQHLIMTSKETGVANKITTTVTDVSDGDNTDNLGLSRLAYDLAAIPTAIANLSETNAAQNAQITIDGSLVVTNSTNEFINVIDGVDITAKKMHDVDDDNDISKISLSVNNANIKAGVEKFVESYNAFQELGKRLGKGSEEGSGPLAGDSLLRGVMSKLRQELSKSFDSGNGSTLSLSGLGVESDQYGVLTLDSDMLNEFVDNDVNGVEQFFVGTDSVDGFAASIDKLTSFYTDTDGIIQNRIDSRTTQLDRLDDDNVAFTRRMESLEARLFKQYNAMDLLVAQLNSTSSYIMAQLDNMPGVVRKDN